MPENIPDKSYAKKPGTAVIYLAGGCFWGLEKAMRSLPGVTDAVSGYANGTLEDPDYRAVCTGKTGHRETVRVVYDPEKISLDAILFAYFSVIDPTRKNAQGHDVGPQYQAGVYYADGAAREAVERVAGLQRRRYKRFAVETEPLGCFYEAEEYHQRYLDKNPQGYCHIPGKDMRRLGLGVVDPGDYRRPPEAEIASRLTETQYRVTQEAATEPPFQNPLWDRFERGLYVDIVTGEPLFSSRDKYESGCGWPSFKAAVDENAVVELPDNTHFMRRTEVKSRAGDSHLGHVFTGDPESPNGVRYCINSAALRFIPYEDMEAEGYGYLKEFV